MGGLDPERDEDLESNNAAAVDSLQEVNHSTPTRHARSVSVTEPDSLMTVKGDRYIN